MIASATTVLSLTALARIAERHARTHGPISADDLVDHLFLACSDQERAQAGVRLALLDGRLVFDRDATIRAAQRVATSSDPQPRPPSATAPRATGAATSNSVWSDRGKGTVASTYLISHDRRVTHLTKTARAEGKMGVRYD